MLATNKHFMNAFEQSADRLQVFPFQLRRFFDLRPFSLLQVNSPLI
jgi:hypothetical protein